MANLGLDVRPVMLVHFSKHLLNILNCSKLLFVVDDLNLSIFVDEKVDICVQVFVVYGGSRLPE